MVVIRRGLIEANNYRGLDKEVEDTRTQRPVSACTGLSHLAASREPASAFSHLVIINLKMSRVSIYDIS